MGIANQLNDIDRAFGVIAKFPEMKGKPIVIGESDPDGCAACQGPQLGYRNTTMYSSYTAASFAREYELADRHGVNLEGVLTWPSRSRTSPSSPATASSPAAGWICRCSTSSACSARWAATG